MYLSGQGWLAFSNWTLLKRGSAAFGLLTLLVFLIYVNDILSQITNGLLIQCADNATFIIVLCNY